MRLTITIVAFVGWVFASASPSVAGEMWRCAVEDFKGFSDDADFRAENLQKKFVLTITDTEVIVAFSSPDFSGSEARYQLLPADTWDQHALNAQFSAYDILSMPRDPGNRIEEQGYFNVTITYQSSFIANSWLLRCAE